VASKITNATYITILLFRNATAMKIRDNYQLPQGWGQVKSLPGCGVWTLQNAHALLSCDKWIIYSLCLNQYQLYLTCLKRTSDSHYEYYTGNFYCKRKLSHGTTNWHILLSGKQINSAAVCQNGPKYNVKQSL